MQPTKPPKPEPRTVASDDYVVVVDDVEYHPHAGETVTVKGSPSIAEERVFWRFNRLSVELQALVGEPGGLAKQSQLLDEGYGDLCAAIARHVTAWSWTDDDGNPVPQPDGTPGPIEALSGDEVYYLRDVVRGRTAKNAVGA